MLVRIVGAPGISARRVSVCAWLLVAMRAVLCRTAGVATGFLCHRAVLCVELIARAIAVSCVRPRSSTRAPLWCYLCAQCRASSRHVAGCCGAWRSAPGAAAICGCAGASRAGRVGRRHVCRRCVSETYIMSPMSCRRIPGPAHGSFAQWALWADGPKGIWRIWEWREPLKVTRCCSPLR